MRSLKLSAVFQGLSAQLHPVQRQLALGNEGVVQRVFAQDAAGHVLRQPAGLIGLIVAAPFTIEIVVVQLLQPGMGCPPFPLSRLQAWQDLGPFLIKRFQPTDACQIFRGQQGGEAVARLAAAMQMTLRGSPCIYQGDELGLPEVELSFEQLQDPYGIRMWPEFKGRDGCRTPFPWKKRGTSAGFSDAPKTWLPIPPEHRELAVDQQTRNPDSMLNFYRNLLAWRKTHPALLKGRLKLLPADPQLLGYERRLDDDALLCVFNFSGKKARLPLPRGWADGVIDEGSGLTGAEIRRGALVLEPWSGAVLIRP